MDQRDLPIEGSQGCGKARGCVSLDEDRIGMLLVEDCGDTLKCAGGDLFERLARPDDVKIVLWMDPE